jgi:hypothetical protein
LTRVTWDQGQESYSKTLDKDTTLLLSTDGNLFRHLKQTSVTNRARHATVNLRPRSEKLTLAAA